MLLTMAFGPWLGFGALLTGVAALIGLVQKPQEPPSEDCEVRIAELTAKVRQPWRYRLTHFWQ